MNRALQASALLLSLSCAAAQAEETQVLERGPHRQIVLHTGSVTEPDGSSHVVTNQFTQLANCLSYFDGQQWQLANDRFQAFENGFACNETQSRVILSANLNVANAVDVTTVDGQRFELSPIFLAMRDATGNGVLVGEIQDSIGQQIAPNLVLYDQAFQGIGAAIQYFVTK